MRCGCNSHGSFLTAKGLRRVEEAAQREHERDYGLAVGTGFGYLDKVGSVSGSNPPKTIIDDSVIDQQYRRFHSGS